MADTLLYIHEVAESATDSGDGLTFNLQHYNGVESGFDINVYSDGILQLASSYTFSGGDDSTLSSITFDSSQSGNTITCDYTWSYTCADGEDATVYRINKTLNINNQIDANGNIILTEGYNKVTDFAVYIEWSYQDDSFRKMILDIVDGNKTKFGIERLSHSTYDTEYDFIDDLHPVPPYPEYSEIAGVPGLAMISLTAVQIGVNS